MLYHDGDILSVRCADCIPRPYAQRFGNGMSATDATQGTGALTTANG